MRCSFRIQPLYSESGEGDNWAEGREINYRKPWRTQNLLGRSGKQSMPPSFRKRKAVTHIASGAVPPCVLLNQLLRRPYVFQATSVDKEKGEKPMHLNTIDGHQIHKAKAQGTHFYLVLLVK